MAFSAALADRVRTAVSRYRGISEKKMFGGLGFLLRGNLLVGIWKQSLVVRLGPDAAEQALAQPHVRPFDVTGKPMRGWVIVEPDGLERDAQLSDWVALAESFVSTLPTK